jgi:hypothetical protein
VAVHHRLGQADPRPRARFPIESLPRLEHELRDWLLTRYREKDALLEHYYSTGAFPAEG